MGTHEGLGLIEGSVHRFPETDLKVPHMGWNQIIHDGSHRLLSGVSRGAYAYFVHSYYCRPVDRQAIIAEADYGLRFAAIIGQNNVYGIQFHPEKSQKVGLRILKNYLEMD
jgi:glutamine amidotransferase